MLSFRDISLLAVLGIGLVYVTRSVSYRRRMRGAKQLPGPKGLPIVGNIFDLSGPNLVPTFNKWNKDFGPIVAFDILGTKQVVLGTDKVTNDLFVQRGNIYSGRGIPAAIEFISQGFVTALMQRNDQWRRQRKLLHTLLAGTVATSHEPFTELETTYALHDLLETPEDFNNHMDKYTYGIIYRLALGRSIGSVRDDVIRESSTLTDDQLDAFRPDKFVSNLIPALIKAPAWLVPSNGRLRDIKDRMLRRVVAAENHVKEGMRNGTAPDSWMRHFLENKHEYGIAEDEARMMFDAITSAGTRSPYNSLLSFIIAMMEHPEWQKKLQDEVDRVVGSERLPLFEDLPNLPIVRAIVKEVIRYRSIVAEIGIPHAVEQDDFYEGYFIPKGTILHANYSAILSEPEMYPDGPVFNPDRWLNPAYPTYKEPLTIYPDLMNFTSFGYGRRACPGTNFSERALAIMVARIAWGCNIRKPIDPVTKKEIQLNIEYEPTPNPKPLPFPADITPRSAERTELVKKEAKRRRETDPLMHKS